MMSEVRVRPAIRTSGNKPDNAPAFGGTAKPPSFYIRMALKKGHLRQRERKLLSALLRDFERAESERRMGDFLTSATPSSLSLADVLMRDGEEQFVNFIETIIFSSQASFEAWVEEGVIIEDKRSGARTIFREILTNPQRYRLVLSMKNRKGSGVVFKDILSGKTLLPRKWGMVKGLAIGRFYIVRVDDGRVTRILSH